MRTLILALAIAIGASTANAPGGDPRGPFGDEYGTYQLSVKILDANNSETAYTAPPAGADVQALLEELEVMASQLVAVQDTASSGEAWLAICDAELIAANVEREICASFVPSPGRGR